MFSFERIAIKDAWYIFIPDFLLEKETYAMYDYFHQHLAWESSEITVFGKTYSTPRLEAFYALENQSYSYSGKKLKVHKFDAELLKLKQRIEAEILHEESFNSVLANLYRNGLDSNGWHADNEKELGKNPLIASLSLGETRRFDLKHNLTKEKLSFDLKAGSLLIMGGSMQHFWKHQIAKSKKVGNARINLTFRKIIPNTLNRL
jgi:alkylated DNA repair dioxygenase AlkB